MNPPIGPMRLPEANRAQITRGLASHAEHAGNRGTFSNAVGFLAALDFADARLPDAGCLCQGHPRHAPHGHGRLAHAIRLTMAAGRYAASRRSRSSGRARRRGIHRTSSSARRTVTLSLVSAIGVIPFTRTPRRASLVGSPASVGPLGGHVHRSPVAQPIPEDVCIAGQRFDIRVVRERATAIRSGLSIIRLGRFGARSRTDGLRLSRRPGP